MTNEEKVDAIGRVEAQVRGELNGEMIPDRVIEVLFEELHDVIGRGETWMRLPRRDIRDRIEKKLKVIGDTTFKNAVQKLDAALAKVRPRIGSVVPLADNRPGVACIETMIGGTRHLVFVRRHNLSPKMIDLEVEFRPLSDSPATAEAIDEGRLVVAGGEALPEEIGTSLRQILENITVADRIFCQNPHARDFIRRHFNDVVKRLKGESELWAMGEIDTEYDDFLLWTSWVSKLGPGDELLSLTDWESEGAWWASLDGRQFLHANEIAIGRKAAVRRIFVHQSSEEPAMRKLRDAEMKRHGALGIDVCEIVLPESAAAMLLPAPSRSVLRSRNAHDIVHGWLMYKVDTRDEDGGGLVNRFSVNPVEIRESERMLERVWRIAQRR